MTVLRWSPKSGFVKFGVYTCLPEVRHVDYGTVLASPEFIQMYSEIPRNGSESISVKYLPVKWGKRHYLISENQIVEFYNYVAGYGSKIDEYVPLDFLLRDGDGNKPVEGMPVFPPGYERFVKKPIDATITAVSARVLKRRRNDDGSFFYESHIPVTLNVGSMSGVKRGMSFNVLASETNETVEIIRVGRDSSTGVIIRWLDDNLSETYKDWETDEMKPLPTISVGWQLSTRPTNP